MKRRKPKCKNTQKKSKLGQNKRRKRVRIGEESAKGGFLKNAQPSLNPDLPSHTSET